MGDFIGTTWFFVVGAVVVIGLGVMLFVLQKKKNDD